MFLTLHTVKSKNREGNKMDSHNNTAWLLREEEVKSIISQRFDGCRCHKAFPDQLHTFVGDCSSDTQVVALVPKGDVRFSSNKIDGNNIIVVIGEDISADYIEFLEDMQISYIFAGKNGKDIEVMKTRLKHDFGIETLQEHHNGKAA